MNVEELLKILACPACRSSLTLRGSMENPEGFACDQCKCVYPIRDEIPIMLIDESISFDDWQKSETKGD